MSQSLGSHFPHANVWCKLRLKLLTCIYKMLCIDMLPNNWIIAWISFDFPQKSRKLPLCRQKHLANQSAQMRICFVLVCADQKTTLNPEADGLQQKKTTGFYFWQIWGHTGHWNFGKRSFVMTNLILCRKMQIAGSEFHQQHEFIDPTCPVSTLKCGGSGVMV